MNGNESNICGIRIKVLRKKNNLTQKQLAELLHMSRSVVLKYETGRQMPPVDRICDMEVRTCRERLLQCGEGAYFSLK